MPNCDNEDKSLLCVEADGPVRISIRFSLRCWPSRGRNEHASTREWVGMIENWPRARIVPEAVSILLSKF